MKKTKLHAKKMLAFSAFLFMFSCSQETEIIEGSENATTSVQTSESDLMLQKTSSGATILRGPERHIGNGMIRSWFTLNLQTNTPQELGVEMTASALTGLSNDGEEHINPIYTTPHPLAKKITALDHIGINWEGQGHFGPPPYGGMSPTGFFKVPHFDIHFYFISFAEREAIYKDTTVESIQLFNNFPDNCFLPNGYFIVPINVNPNGGNYAKVGKHWVPPLPLPSPQLTHLMTYGTYNYKIAFVETQVSLPFLESGVDYEGEYTQPVNFQKSNYYPTKYKIRHNTENGKIYITLTNFVYREASSNCE
ncbi:hypothetical protein ACFS5J_04165 [Flavobacterium chuncheonense]|uniref:DUF5602 domain-containing protein n=1 Tax=Flavobacterium chuncheonense TaxID=2026653 RepID=A0ABW5YL26_9FLAO